MQGNNRTYETIISWDKVASERRKTEKFTPQRMQAQFGMLFKLQLQDTTRYQRVNILNLDMVTALERSINFCSWATASQTGSSSTQAQ